MMDLHTYILIWVSVIGLCLGSFYNVVILRSLSNESIIYPPSKCPKCNNKLYWWHNIPLVSYLLLKGKCYFCKEKISIQYPIVELTTMLLFIATFQKFGISLQTLLFMLVLSCLLIMTVTDIKEKLVDCNIAIIMALIGLLYSAYNSGINGIISSILGLVVGAIVIEIIARFGFLIVKTRAMGEADTYVAGALGAIFGFPAIINILIYALIASMIFIVPLFLYNKYTSNDKKTCILSILFVLSVLFFKTVVQNYATMLLVIIIGVLLAISVLKEARNESCRNYLPYVPALSAGALYYLFFVLL